METANMARVDWDALATLEGPALERALARLTGIACESYATRPATGESRTEHGARREVVADADALALLADAQRHTGRADHTTTRGIVADAAHVVPDVRTALVLSAVMHADVVSASGRVVTTRLARHLTGDDDRTTRDVVADALTDALLHLADALADATAERDADVVSMPHVGRPGHVTGARAVIRDAGTDAELVPAFTVRATRAERADDERAAAASRPGGHVPGDVRTYARPGRVRPVLTCPDLGYPYDLGYSPVRTHEGPTLPYARGTRAPAPWRGSASTGMLATALARTGGPLGQGHTLRPGTDDKVRDALGRVPLATGWTISPERLAAPLTSERKRPERAAGTRARTSERRERLAALRVTRRAR